MLSVLINTTYTVQMDSVMCYFRWNYAPKNVSCSACLSLGGAVVEQFISWYVDWIWRPRYMAVRVTALRQIP